MKLLTNDEEWKQVWNDTMVLKQEKIESEKITRENNFIQEEEFKSKVTDLKNECGYNKTII